MESVLGLIRHSGNDGLFRAIEMSLLATAANHPLHLHAEGLRGTGKTTIMRAVRRVLPRIRRITGCLYNCHPAHPHCPLHKGLSAEVVAGLGDEWVPMPFLEISHSAKVGTVVGSIDLGRLVNPSAPEAAMLPGTIPQAHRGIIFVDEINRLAETAPELADVLLDVMGTKPGRVQIEETGLPSVELPVQVTVWAASNPDEDPGPLEDIRRQLSDRFDFVVYTDRPTEARVVEQILASTALGGWPQAVPAPTEHAAVFQSRLAERVAALAGVQVPGHLRQTIADLYSRFNVESLRAVQAIQLGARLSACVHKRPEATGEDLARATMLALRHRVDQETIKKVTAHLAVLSPRGEAPVPAPAAAAGRSRFQNVSLGGAAMEAPPRPADTRDSLPPSAQNTWVTQYPPQPVSQPQASPPAPPDHGRQQAQGAGDRAGWLNRALTGLKRNLGLNAQQELEESPPPARDKGLRPSQANQGLTSPRPGRLFQQAEQQASAGGAQGPGGDLRGRPGGVGGQSQGTGQGQVADPLKVQAMAPPNPARPIGRLDPTELVRSEEELGRR